MDSPRHQTSAAPVSQRPARGVLTAVVAALSVWSLHATATSTAAQDLDAATAAAQAASQPQKLAKLLQAAEPMLARVAITLKYDRGEEPSVHGLRYRCPNCGGWHYHHSGRDVVREQRPMELGGFAISNQRVVISDPMVHQRFIEKIEVSQGQASVPARIAGWAQSQRGIVLELEKPLESIDARPFDADASGPFFAVTYSVAQGRWTTAITPMGGAVLRAEDGRLMRGGPNNALILNAEGKPVAVWMNETMPLDDSWKGSPAKQWRIIPAKQMEKKLDALKQTVEHVLPRVHLSFRSPTGSAAEEMRTYGGMDDEQATERDVPGVVIGKNLVLVLASLQPQVTARLERVRVHPGGDSDAVIEAEFLATLADYGALVVKTKQPMEHVADLAANMHPQAMKDELLASVDLKIAGEQYVATLQPIRVTGIDIGHKRMLLPEAPNQRESHRFLFTRGGKLLALPLSVRQPQTEQWYSQQLLSIPTRYLAPVLAEPAKHGDKNNVPLSEAEENRLAWLGVELQEMTPELARESQVADQTQDGDTGAIVSYVYPGSPAAKAGLELGDVLLRLNVQGFPQPIPIHLGHQYHAMGGQFPWDQLDQLPEAYFDRIPQPWPSARNSINVQLTKLGFGTAFVLHYARDGKIRQAELEVKKGPDNYDSAARHKSEALGATVRELTYEVRRYFQIPEDAPGLILSKVEPGSKASVAGLRPFEIITHAGGKPMHKAEDFKQAIADGGELRFSVKRMHRQRIVKLELPKAEEDGK